MSQLNRKFIGNYPDFVIDIAKQQIAIEARAFLVSPEEREKKEKYNRFTSALSGIEKPFSVHLKLMQFGDKPNIEDFITKACHWLDTTYDKLFIYQDDFGNILELSAEQAPRSKKVGVFSSEGLWVNPDLLKSPLSQKASQHKALRNSGYPYIIAIYLEPYYFSAEEVAEAWLGKTTIVYDIDAKKVVEEKLDQSGIHYWAKEIRHKSVTGTLVFKAEYNSVSKSRYLKSGISKIHMQMYI